jgi:hypothetical protein
MAKPIPNLDVPVIDLKSGLMGLAWYEFIQYLLSLLNSTATTLSGVPGQLTAKSDITRSINPQTGTTYTFVLADAGKACEFTNGSAIAVTIPLNSSVAFPTGTQIDVMAGGAGKVTFAGAGGVTLKSFNSYKSLAGQEAGGTLLKTATDTWRLMGSLIP